MLQSLFVIDDDKLTLQLCEIVAKQTSFAQEVFSFAEAQKALNFFSAYCNKKSTPDNNIVLPDLILLDLNMPSIDGWDFLNQFERKYAERLPNVKIAILTSSVNPADFMKAQKFSFVIDFINKPLAPTILQEMKQHKSLMQYFT